MPPQNFDLNQRSNTFNLASLNKFKTAIKQTKIHHRDTSKPSLTQNTSVFSQRGIQNQNILYEKNPIKYNMSGFMTGMTQHKIEQSKIGGVGNRTCNNIEILMTEYDNDHSQFKRLTKQHSKYSADKIQEQDLSRDEFVIIEPTESEAKFFMREDQKLNEDPNLEDDFVEDDDNVDGVSYRMMEHGGPSQSLNITESKIEAKSIGISPAYENMMPKMIN